MSINLDSYIRDKIYIDENKHNIYKKLKEDLGLFSTMKDIFIISAAIGFSKGIKKPIEKRKDIFIKNNFDKDKDIPFLFILAIADKKDKEAVMGDVIENAELYANAGIEIIEEIVKHAKDRNQAIDELSAFLMEGFS